MIQINLLPGGQKRSARRMPKIALPGGGRLKVPAVGGDRLTMFIVATSIIGPLAIGYMWWSLRTERQEVEVSIEGAVRDSTQYAALRAANQELQARQDTITQKLQIIQEIDGGRYVWAHVLDEISRALPQYTWLTLVNTSPVSTDVRNPLMQIEGRVGNTFALTRFMQDLEASPFLRGVTLRTTQQIQEGEKTMYSFTLEAQYEQPSPDVIQTVPLFASEAAVTPDAESN